MLKIDIVSNPIFDGMILEIEDNEDITTICYTFDTLIDNILDCSGGKILQRWNDIVLFSLPDISRVYGICKDEYMQLIVRDHVELKAFTDEEYRGFLKMIAKFGDVNTEYLI